MQIDKKYLVNYLLLQYVTVMFNVYEIHSTKLFLNVSMLSASYTLEVCIIHT